MDGARVVRWSPLGNSCEPAFGPRGRIGDATRPLGSVNQRRNSAPGETEDHALDHPRPVVGNAHHESHEYLAEIRHPEDEDEDPEPDQLALRVHQQPGISVRERGEDPRTVQRGDRQEVQRQKKYYSGVIVELLEFLLQLRIEFLEQMNYHQ